MGFLDKAKAGAQQAAHRANETVADVQTKRALTKAYNELGKVGSKLVESGAISHPELEAQVARIRELQTKLEGENGAAVAGAAAESTEAVEQPLSGAGHGAA